MAGGATSVISGRVAYSLGWEGPVATVDTACSSSLVALHLAVRALRRGECGLALAGGVAVMATPAMFAQFSAQGGLSFDGRCKAFSDSADGTGWSEGAGVVLLERLSDARELGHPVLAVVRGTAINSDGASNGLTAPNGPSQQRVIRTALEDAELTPGEVDAVDAHGTGTMLGDPIEAQALLATYGREHSPENPLLLGALKSNIGHTQSAAGVGGVIKMILAMRHGTLPRTLHVSEPSTQVDWSDGTVSLLTEPTAWPSSDHPRRAAVSSFGISGSNAHVVLEQAPAETPDGGEEADPTLLPRVVPWLLSARSADALPGQAKRLVTAVEDGLDEISVARSLATTRQAFEHRAILLGTNKEELLSAARALAAGEDSPEVVRGTTVRGRTAALFPGQGSQYRRMSRDLAEASPAFSAALSEICGHLDPHLDRPLREMLEADTDELDQTGWTQPALFAIEVALYRLWESWGVVPQLLLGHSIGSLAAAHVSGVLSLSDACALVAARGRIMQALPVGGAMISLDAPEDEVHAALAGREEEVGIAAVNGPRATVISGDEAAVTELAERFATEGVRTTRLRGSHAFHSPRMEPGLDEFRRVAESVTYGKPRIPIISDLTGVTATDEELADPEYWVRHARQTVRFADAVATARGRGATRFVEVGPGSTLTSLVRGAVDDDRELVLVPGLRRNRPETRSITEAMARLHAGGVSLSWDAFFAGWGGRRIDLPTYAFTRERFWLTPTTSESSKQSTEDGSFWDAVSRADADSLSRTLGLPDATPALREVMPTLTQWHRARQEAASVDALCYRVRWEPVADITAAAPTGRWIALVPTEPAACEAADAVVDGLRATGIGIEPIEVGQSIDRAALAAEFSARTEGSKPEETLSGVVSLLALDTTAHSEHPALTRGFAATVAAIQALDDLGVTAPLWCLTRGAVSTGRADPAPDPEQAVVWGAGRVAAIERPRSWAGLIDLPTASLDQRGLSRLGAILTGGTEEDQVAIRPAAVLTRRLLPSESDGHHRAVLPDKGARQPGWQPTGTVLITGGTGALGAHVARWCAARGAEHLVLTSRKGTEAAGAAELAEELRTKGARVTIAACDVADRDALAAVLAEHPVNAVVHAAGVADQTPLESTDATEIASALQAKVLGAKNLEALLDDTELDAFVLFSSIAGVWGAAGQSAYAAANAFLDALALRRRAEGLPATALAWGPWSGSGMAADAESEAHLRRRGLRGLDPERALTALDRAVARGDATTVVAEVEWDRFHSTFTIARPAPLFSGVVGSEPLPTTVAPAGAARGRERIREVVISAVAAVLGHADPEAVEAGRNFQDLGFDSLTAVELRNRLERQLTLSLPPGLVFDYPNPRALTEHLHQLTGSDEAAPERGTAQGTGVDLDDPVVIVSLGCRFPGGVAAAEDLWTLVCSGQDVMGPPPDDRGWDADTVSEITGGFLRDAAGFDAGFFGISPREALAMDPQQRLLLEVTWETLERAHINPQSLLGSRTGVFVGTNGADYAGLVWASPDDTVGHASTGNAASVLSGRIAYALGLEGPAITVDTACSSSLVALHWAAHALRTGECDLAVAGGVTVMATPGAFTDFGRQGGLAPDGRCKPFSADADGTTWSEGAGLVLLERASDARANGHPILAVLRGSAINQDGASNGLTAPNGPSQQRVIRAALDSAGLLPSDVDTVEAHGTGTTLGDPIEAQALAVSYGSERDRPLLLGSIKSHLGHTQAAAGVAGVIKMVLALQHGQIPPTLHAGKPTPHIDWDQASLALPQETTDWPHIDRPRRAGISSFGISGTNAHVILEQAETSHDPGALADDSDASSWVLSAHGPAALQEQARNLVERRDLPDRDIAYSLARRAVFDHRAVITGEDRAQALTALAQGQQHPQLITGHAGPSRLGVVFSGQGSQRPGTGRELYETYPVFADALDAVCAHLDQHLDRPLRTVLFDAESEVLDETGWTQPALFALHVAQYRLLESWGVRPDVLLGHSIGEIAAAHVAGVLSLPDAARLVVDRARLMQRLPAGGAMLAVTASEQTLTPYLAGYERTVDIAAINSPESTVLSGRAEDLDELGAALAEAGHRNQRLRVSHAFHSPLVDPMLAEFRESVARVRLHRPELPIVSTLTGRTATDEELTSPDYWVDHVRRTVRLVEAVATATDAHNITHYLEITPHTSLAPHISSTASETEVTSTLRHGRPEIGSIQQALAALWTTGSPVDWGRVVGHGRHIDLPTYPFQHQHYWPHPGRRQVEPGGHPLLGAGVEVAATGEWVFTAELSLVDHPWLAEHVIGGQVLVPGTAMLDMAAHAARITGCPHIAELTLHTPLVLTSTSRLTLQLVAGRPDDDGHRPITIHTREHDDAGEWRQHATGDLAPEDPSEPGTEVENWPSQDAEELDIDDLYAYLDQLGYTYGPLFQGLRNVWHNGKDLFCEADVPAAAVDQDGYELHPALLDSLLHPLTLTGTGSDLPSGGGVPFSFTGVRVHASGVRRVRARLRAAEPDGVTIDLTSTDGQPVARIAHLRQRQHTAAIDRQDGLYALAWVAHPESTADRGEDECAVLVSPDSELPESVTLAPVWTWVPAGEDVSTATRGLLHQVLSLLQRWLAQPDPAPLVLATRGAVATGPGERPDPVQAAVWGLVRTAQNEHPDVLTLLDLDSEETNGVAAWCVGQEVSQAAVRGGEVLLPRWENAEPATLTPPESGAWRIGVPATASLSDLAMEPAPEVDAPLAAGQVRIAVRAAGLNFRDVLNALGMYPGEAGLLGGEVAGVIIEVADDVTGVAVGDAVMGMVSGAFGPTVLADRRLITPIPEDWSYTQAATTPLVFLTAYYALIDLADLRSGETVLVHAATGGVGMAAVQLAQHLGARVLGTAHPSKWPLLREMGLAEADIASSRTAEFADRFPRADVVLNALTGEMLDASLDLLVPGGRFLEMGKTDVRDPEQVADSHGVTYRAFDTRDAGPDRLAEILDRLGDLFATGALRPLPVTSWDMRQADQAFRYLAQARHTGKIALTAPHTVDLEDTVIITGGTGGLGAHFARHLAQRGHRHLLLASRRGPDAPGAAELAAEVAELGAEVRILACDLTEPGSVAELFAQARTSVSTVLHTAGVLQDATVDHLTGEHLEAVLAAKLDATLALDRHTRGLPQPCELVLFSSVAGTLGSPGQGNYAAANAALDALAARRAHDGHPTRSLAWGPWSTSSGMTSTLTAEHTQRMTHGPFSPLSPEDGLRLYIRSQHHSRADLLAAHLNPGHTHTHPMLVHHNRTPLKRTSGARGGDLPSRLADQSSHERHSHLLELIRSHTATVLGYSGPEDIPPQHNFQHLGTDSLTAIELRNRLAQATGLRLPATLVFDHPTPDELAGHLDEQLTPLGAQDRRTAGTKAERPTHTEGDPIVITALGCHFPPAITTPEQLWNLLTKAEATYGSPPADRGWDPAHLPPAIGGHLHHASSFDSTLFNISPREAVTIDPQQRVLLHTAWETLERAHIDPHSLRGSMTGVFVGTNYQGYGSAAHATPEGEQGTSIAGHAASVTSGRIAYTLGFEGPAITVDTACSSSLVALHWAAHALRTGECDLALAGGVTIMATPGAFAEFDRHGGLAPDGRCKPFSAQADGTSWSEGAGLVLLERLSDAQASGHPILAVLRGSAVNQDGASNGLTAPNGPSQQRVIRAALDAAGLQPSDVDAVEAHGTGTTLGDPIEAQALAASYGQDRDRPLWLGSIKSNLGHTQSAAGIAGVLKCVLALQHHTLPPTLHAEEPTGHLDWETSNLRLVQANTPWHETGHPRRVGVSSFGISGTNAHMILEQPAEDTSTEDESSREGPVLWALSGHGDAALRAQVRNLIGHLTDRDDPPAAVAHALAATRATLPHRAAVVGADRDALLSALGALARDEDSPGLLRGPAEGVHTRARTAFLFSGQGSQRLGAGAQLIESYPAFAESFWRICTELDEHLDRPLREVLFAEESSPEADLLERTQYTQAALFALEVAAHDLLRSWGVRPDFLLGHSIGEIAAAHVAGVFDLSDAARLVAARGRLMQSMPGDGAMIALAVSEEEVRPLVIDREGVDIAAVNGPSAVVISGDAAAVEDVAEHWRQQGRKTRRLRTSHAFHSSHMDAMLEPFEEVAATVTYAAPRVPLISNVTGEIATAEQVCSPRYWVRHAREAVRFGEGLLLLADQGVSTVIELGPDAVLAPAAAESMPAGTTTVPLLRRDHDERSSALHAVAALHVHGVEVSLPAVFPSVSDRPVDLPTYAFQGTRFWLENANPASATGGDARFWEAVEQGDLGGLAGLSLPSDASVHDLLPALAYWRHQELRRQEIDSWEYEVHWIPVTDPGPAVLTGTWILVRATGDNTVAELIHAELVRAGAAVEIIEVDPSTVDRATLVSDLPAATTGVVSLLGMDTDEVRGLRATLALIQALGDATLDVPLWSVTLGGVTTGDDGVAPSPAQAAVWGAGRVAALEHPRRWGGLIDLPARPQQADAAQLVSVVDGRSGEDQLAVRRRAILARRLRHTATTSPAWAPSGTVLITGGSGALGLRLARRVAERGADRVVLVSRRGATADTEVLAAELESHGTEVTVAACDVADSGAVTALLDKVRSDGPPLTAVVHAAGVLDDGPIDDLTPDRLEAVLAAKSRAAAVLDRATREDELAAFVLFSSLAGSVGGMGQANYAAANAALDAIALSRRQAGPPATSLAWGPWAGGGMASEDRMRRAGLEPLDPDLALDALERIVGSGRATSIVAHVDWARFAPGFAGLRAAPLLADLPEVAELGASEPAGARDSADLRQELAELSGADRIARLVTLVRSSVALVLGLSSHEAVPAQRAFSELGFDSLMAVELRNRLAAATGLTPPPTLLFDQPNAATLGEYLAGQLDTGSGGSGGQRSVLTELDRLESLLLGASGKGGDEERITARLRDMLARWTDATCAETTGSAGDSADAPDAATRLQSATADEVFAYIDNDLGL
jgi:acyl transferase domain-containing protein/acyl carrier protein